MELIRTENLSVVRGDKEILKNVSFSLQKGEKVFLLGPNGSGKTSFLETILGFLEFEGRIFFKGRELKKEEDFYEVRVSCGYVFQNPDDQLFSPTVEEELAFGPLNLGLPKEEVAKRIENVLESFGLLHLKETPIYKLSGGQKRVVALASVLTMEPECLLLDEPTNDLDEENFSRLLEFLRNVDKSVVVITHDNRLLKSLNWKRYKLISRQIVPL